MGRPPWLYYTSWCDIQRFALLIVGCTFFIKTWYMCDFVLICWETATELERAVTKITAFMVWWKVYDCREKWHVWREIKKTKLSGFCHVGPDFSSSEELSTAGYCVHVPKRLPLMQAANIKLHFPEEICTLYWHTVLPTGIIGGILGVPTDFQPFRDVSRMFLGGLVLFSPHYQLFCKLWL